METENQTSTSPKVIGIISYLTIVGLIVAAILHQKTPSKFGGFHVRQAIGITMIFVVAKLVAFVPFFGWISAIGLVIFGVLCWVIGFISALQGEEKPVPGLGESFQEWFASI